MFTSGRVRSVLIGRPCDVPPSTEEERPMTGPEPNLTAASPSESFEPADLDLVDAPLDSEVAEYVDDPSILDDPAQEAPKTDNALRPEDGPQDVSQDPGEE
jgi:hypothetical protein